MKYFIGKLPDGKVARVMRVSIPAFDINKQAELDGMDYTEVDQDAFEIAYPCPEMFTMDSGNKLQSNLECSDTVSIPSSVKIHTDMFRPDHVDVKNERGEDISISNVKRVGL